MLSQVITFVKLFPSVSAGFRTSPSVSVKAIAPKAQIEALRARCGGGLSRPFGRGVGVRPDNALRMNYDYECITITALRKPSPRLTRAPGFASGATERTGAAFRPDGAMIQDQGPDPRGGLQQSGVGRSVVPLRTPQNGSGGVKTGYGGGAPMQAPAVQPGGHLFAPDGRHAATEAPAPCRPTPRPAPAAGG